MHPTPLLHYRVGKLGHDDVVDGHIHVLRGILESQPYDVARQIGIVHLEYTSHLVPSSGIARPHHSGDIPVSRSRSLFGPQRRHRTSIGTVNDIHVARYRIPVIVAQAESGREQILRVGAVLIQARHFQILLHSPRPLVPVGDEERVRSSRSGGAGRHGGRSARVGRDVPISPVGHLEIAVLDDVVAIQGVRDDGEIVQFDVDTDARIFHERE
mmetsp:Transcript_51818/g.155503  ORF Transcript_51818/g.155503 Transcript_51818/m.155503 type:complete len:213 (-) Transcript_51818:595-1233(-)